MAVRLLLGPAGSGKTGRALRIFKQFTPSEHQHAVRFIVPTVSHVLHIRRLLLSDPDFPGLLGDPICTFHRLASDILADAEGARPKLISDTQKRLLLSEIVRDAPCGYFESVRECPDFPEALGGAIALVKASAVTPDDLRRAVESAVRAKRLPESSRQKISDLAALYQRYEDKISAAKELRDPEDVISHALEVIRANPDLLRAVRCVILDGFSTLTALQQQFVGLLAEHCGELIAAVDCEESRPELFSYVEPSLRFLMELPGASVDNLGQQADAGPAPAVARDRVTALRHLTKYLFAVSPPRLEPDDSVTVLVGATLGVEVQLVAGEIRKLVRERGLQFADFAIVVRSIEPYHRRIASSFREHHIPLGAQTCPLSESTLARTVLHHLRAGSLDAPASAEAAQLIRSIEALIGGFRWPEDEERLREEYAALKSLRRIIAEIVAGAHFSRGEFRELLEPAIRSGAYRVPVTSADEVSLVTARALGGRKFKAVFVLGLVGRVFPRQVREDPFLLDSEREILNPYLPHPLGLRRHEWDYERCLFYSAAACAQERLYLCYPLGDASGRANLPSPYLDEVNALFTREVRRVARGFRDILPPIDQAETAKSLAARTILDCCASTDGQAQETAAAAYNLLLEAGQLGPDAFEWMGEGAAEPSDDRLPADVRELLLGEELLTE